MRYLTLRLSSAVVTPHPAVKRGAVLNTELLDDGTLLELYRLDGDCEEIIEGIDQESSMIDFEVFETEGDQVYLLQHGHPNEQVRELFRLLRAYKLMLVPPIRFAHGSGVTIHVVGDATRLRDAYDAFPQEITEHTTIEQVGQYTPHTAGLTALLTDRQREVLRVAIDVGYYSVPRRGTAEDVAVAIDTAPSTASEHLQKIEAKVLSNVLGERDA